MLEKALDLLSTAEHIRQRITLVGVWWYAFYQITGTFSK